VSVPLKYHHVISQQGAFFRNLRSFGVQVDQSIHPAKSAVPTPPTPSTPAALTARIDDAENGVGEVEAQWRVTENYQDAEEDDSEWALKARDESSLERAKKAVEDAIVHAQSMTHVGFLTLPDRSVFPRIVGTKGANVARLRALTGADITVSRENNTIVIIGACFALFAHFRSRCSFVPLQSRRRGCHRLGKRRHCQDGLQPLSPLSSRLIYVKNSFNNKLRMDNANAFGIVLSPLTCSRLRGSRCRRVCHQRYHLHPSVRHPCRP
jgi:hypothetical protein